MNTVKIASIVIIFWEKKANNEIIINEIMKLIFPRDSKFYREFHPAYIYIV